MSAKIFAIFCFLTTLELRGYKMQTANDSCDECDSSSCHPPGTCLAGMVKDSCGCCYECGLTEGQLCDHPQLSTETSFGTCGENLQCRVRTDLDPEDPPEANCFCVHNQALCGSDGLTYENICQLTEERYRRRDGLRAVSREPCYTAPKIVSAPQDQRNRTGSYVAMLCETTGWPAPAIKWSLHEPGSEGVALPGNNSRIVIHSGTGPGFGDVTSWLLITRLEEDDDATYRCLAENAMGWVSASARVRVLP